MFEKEFIFFYDSFIGLSSEALAEVGAEEHLEGMFVGPFPPP